MYQKAVNGSSAEELLFSTDKELFFEAADGMLSAVPVKAATVPKPSFEVGSPTPLFDARMAVPGTNSMVFEYDVSADGRRFLVTSTGAVTASAPPLTVVVNWNAELTK